MDRLLERGMKFHRDRLPEVAAVTVSIIARDGAIEELEAVPGRRDIDAFTVEQNIGSEESFDWIVPEQRLLINGVKREPEEGWLIKWKMPDGRTGVYRASRGDRQRCFDVLDQLGILYRIHTNLVKIETHSSVL